MAHGGSYRIVDGKRMTEAEYLAMKAKPKAKKETTPKSGQPDNPKTKSSEE